MNLRNKKFATVGEYNTYMEGDYLKPNVSYIVESGLVKYQKDAPAPPEEQYLTFVALEDGTFQLSQNNVDYSLDGGATWTTLSADTASPTVESGSTIMWKGELMPQKFDGIGTFSSTGTYNAKGNIMSLLFGDDFKGQTDLTGKYKIFKSTFSGAKIVDASKLIMPATTLYEQCYHSMFAWCSYMTAAPALPATTLASYCYTNMFRNCTSLTAAPVLAAETVPFYGYQGMFYECSSLNYIKMLATNVSASQCLGNWVKSVSATGTFTKAAGANIPTGDSGIPSGWTVIEE